MSTLREDIKELFPLKQHEGQVILGDNRIEFGDVAVVVSGAGNEGEYKAILEFIAKAPSLVLVMADEIDNLQKRIELLTHTVLTLSKLLSEEVGGEVVVRMNGEPLEEEGGQDGG